MIDCLSNPAWIEPQIDFLLFLQNIRLNCSDIIDKFFLSITVFGEFWLPTIICAITYWCIDFRAGIYLFSLEGFNILFTHLFKMLACVYRPWVLDNRIQPSRLAIPFAKGYSFPSGHSAMSSSVFGGIAYLVRKNKWLCAFFICLILSVGFSRLWLGVHTPQDVICGLSTGLILVFVINKVIEWAEKNRNRYLYLLTIVDSFVALALFYLYTVNTYRMDYVDGKLLVDPQTLKYHTIVVYGYALGLINGCFLCRRFFPFEPKDATKKQRIIRGIIGAIAVIILLRFVIEYVIMETLPLKYAGTMTFFVGFFVTLIYPTIFTKLQKYFN